MFNRGYELNAEVFNYRHDLDVPGEGQEVDGTGYEGDEEGIGGGNEVDKEGQGEKKENLRYWIHPEDGQSDDNDKDWEPGATGSCSRGSPTPSTPKEATTRSTGSI